jgi:hypothetical protein
MKGKRELGRGGEAVLVAAGPANASRRVLFPTAVATATTAARIAARARTAAAAARTTTAARAARAVLSAAAAAARTTAAAGAAGAAAPTRAATHAGTHGGGGRVKNMRVGAAKRVQNRDHNQRQHHDQESILGRVLSGLLVPQALQDGSHINAFGQCKRFVELMLSIRYTFPGHFSMALESCTRRRLVA